MTSIHDAIRRVMNALRAEAEQGISDCSPDWVLRICAWADDVLTRHPPATWCEGCGADFQEEYRYLSVDCPEVQAVAVAFGVEW